MLFESRSHQGSDQKNNNRKIKGEKVMSEIKEKLDLSQPVPEPECGIRIIVSSKNGIPWRTKAFRLPETEAPIKCLLAELMGRDVLPDIVDVEWDGHPGVRLLRLLIGRFHFVW